MDRTLFTAAMIETFRACRRAYQLAFVTNEPSKEHLRLSSLCKRFLLKALAEIHRCRVQNVPQVQKYLGQNWPTEKLAVENSLEAQEKIIQAFRFVYRVLCNYVVNPYKPRGSETAGVNLKVRARIPHTKAYLEDTFDLILWHPQKRQLEIVDFHLHALKPFDPAWPSPSLLVRYFLAQRLRSRWPYDKLVFTFCQLQSEGIVPVTIEIDESVFQLHWPDVVKTVHQMKSADDFAPHKSTLCKRCDFLAKCTAMDHEATPTASATCA